MDLANLTQETLALFKAAQGGIKTEDDLRKSVTTGTGLVGFDLQAPAKNLYPYLAPLVKEIPRVPGETGTATNWRVVSAIQGSGYNAMGWVPEGQRSARMSYVTANKAATYVTIGEEDQVSFESVTAARGFEDLRATAAVRLLQKMRMKEEDAILGGNTSIALGVTPSPTVVGSNTGGALAAGTYSVVCVALTYEGFRNSSVAGGVATSQTITGADGLTYTLNGGSANKSASVSSGALSGVGVNSISASVTPVVGAVAYAWYWSTTVGSEVLGAITTINSILITANAAGTQLASAITADSSRNTSVPAFDGLLTWTWNQAGVNVVRQATGTAGTGTPMTSSGRGSVNEIDSILQALWDNYRVSCEVIWMNSQELKNITNKVLSNASGPLLRYVKGENESDAEYRLAASGRIDFYYNPFAIEGGDKIPIKVHPTIPPGTILGYTNTLPPQYQNNNVPRAVEVRTRRDYYEIDWPLRTRQYEMGVYSEEVLAMYAPFTLWSLTNVANG